MRLIKVNPELLRKIGCLRPSPGLQAKNLNRFEARQRFGMPLIQDAPSLSTTFNASEDPEMSEQTGTSHEAPSIAKTLHDRAAQAATMQSELARKVGEINQHWLERIQSGSIEGWEWLFKCGSTPAIGEKIKLCEQWIEGAMKKAAEDANYVVDSAKALGELELRFLSPSTGDEAKRSGSLAETSGS